MCKAFYDISNLMRNVKDAKRYIDDDTGLYSDSKINCELWISHFNRNLNPSGLFIDESEIKDVYEYLTFLNVDGHLGRTT